MSTVLERVVRRETHSPRTIWAVIVLILIALGAIYLGIEIVLALAGVPALLVRPAAGWEWLAGLPDLQPQSAVVAGGIVLGLLGLLLLLIGIAPGRRAKHQLGVTDHPVLVDNAVIASAVAEDVRRELDLSRGGVRVGVSHRAADVTVRPEPGQVVEKEDVRAVAEARLAEYQPSPAIKVHVRVLEDAQQGGSR